MMWHSIRRFFAPKLTLTEYKILLEELSRLRNDVQKLANVAESRIRIYRCIICNKDFARLPNESDRRCSACMAQIKEAGGLGQGNSGHRPEGHNTRGAHKRFGEVGK